MLKLITLWREKVKIYFIKIDSENIYVESVKNKKIVNLEFEKIHSVFIADEFYPFAERRG
jgi:hypothetical protein